MEKEIGIVTGPSKMANKILNSYSLSLIEENAPFKIYESDEYNNSGARLVRVEFEEETWSPNLFILQTDD